jgi:DNA-3-methyladenine glycosylase
VRFNGPARGAEKQRLLAGLSQPPASAARFLLGQVVVRRIARRTLAARIVEVEAYEGEGDPAAHAFRGRTARTEPLWGPPGTFYVYFIYGMHYCLNIAVERRGEPGCVLVRAAEPLEEGRLEPLSCRGPGRLCRTLAIDLQLSGRSAFALDSGLWLREGGRVEAAVSTRIGISAATDRPLRFFDAGSRAVSARPRDRS